MDQLFTLLPVPVGGPDELPAFGSAELLRGCQEGFPVQEVWQADLWACLKFGLDLWLGDGAQVGGVDQPEEEILAAEQPSQFLLHVT